MTPLTVGLVGAGGISHAHAPAWRSLGARLHVFSVDGADELAAAHGARVARSLEELLELADVIDVMTPTDTHHEIASRALAAGKDVLCEKPLARTGSDAADLARRAALAGRRLYPGHVVRYFRQYATMRHAVTADRRVGRPAVLRFSRGGMAPTWSPWFFQSDRSGGLVMDQMIHDLDIARWVAGEVVEVYAVANAADGGGHRVQTAHVVLVHAGGAISHVRGLWGPPHIAFRTSFHVSGDGGELHYDSAAAAGLRADLGPAADAETRPAPASGESPYLTEIRECAAAIAGGPEPRVSAADGVIAVDLAEAALESIRRGEAVRVDTAGRVRDLRAGPEPAAGHAGRVNAGRVHAAGPGSVDL